MASVPRIILELDCATCGRLTPDGNAVALLEAAKLHTSMTSHVVILNGTVDVPEELALSS